MMTMLMMRMMIKYENAFIFVTCLLNVDEGDEGDND